MQRIVTNFAQIGRNKVVQLYAVGVVSLVPDASSMIKESLKVYVRYHWTSGISVAAITFDGISTLFLIKGSMAAIQL